MPRVERLSVFGPKTLTDREVKFTSIPLSKIKIELKSLILAQIERWRHALHMQVERQHDV